MKIRFVILAAALALTGVACGGATADTTLTPDQEEATVALVDHCSSVARNVYASEGSAFMKYLLEQPDEAARVAMKHFDTMGHFDLSSWASAEGSHAVCKLAMVTAVGN